MELTTHRTSIIVFFQRTFVIIQKSDFFLLSESNSVLDALSAEVIKTEQLDNGPGYRMCSDGVSVHHPYKHVLVQ